MLFLQFCFCYKIIHSSQKCFLLCCLFIQRVNCKTIIDYELGSTEERKGRATEPPPQNFFLKETSLAKRCIISCLSQFHNQLLGSPNSFSNNKHSELKLRVFLTGCIIAMVTYYAIKSTTTGSPVAGRLRDTKRVV